MLRESDCSERKQIVLKIETIDETEEYQRLILGEQEEKGSSTNGFGAKTLTPLTCVSFPFM